MVKMTQIKHNFAFLGGNPEGQILLSDSDSDKRPQHHPNFPRTKRGNNDPAARAAVLGRHRLSTVMVMG